ncbi:MAG: rhomboid family intramembrane serine protease [Gammaproteobacteria bacterium]|nr:rhomboid family intramembrane serine protease [Gammaproteobacteria bacterium]NNF62076.1 rhomboid family intramembrane serine protease [Gammaproteobacteria bacterium]NNM20460.1 rhomboid family intramembrane serine protease [Gammaproteobacteria bacterium]
MIPLHDDNPSAIRPLFTYLFIGGCALTFLWQLSLGAGGQQAVFAFGVIPATLLGDAVLSPDIAVIPAELTVITSMFLHGGWAHFLGNMLYLWVFGDNVEDSMGHVRFVLFYLLCGTAAALAQAIPEPDSTIPMIGASGAISGVLGAYLLLYPHARVLVGVPLGFYLHTMRLPAGWILGLWFGMQLLSELMSPPGSAGVAFRAHLGGFVAGAALIPLFRQRGFPLLQPRVR